MSKGLIIGLIVGFILLALVIGLSIYFHERNKNKNTSWTPITPGTPNVPNGPIGPVTCKMPNGSWQKSCKNGTLNGSILTATCPDTSGHSITSSLDLNTCAPGDVFNNLGHLGCHAGTGFCASQ